MLLVINMLIKILYLYSSKCFADYSKRAAIRFGAVIVLEFAYKSFALCVPRFFLDTQETKTIFFILGQRKK